MSRAVREVHMMKYGAPSLGGPSSSASPRSSSSQNQQNPSHKKATTSTKPTPSSTSTAISKRHALDTRTQTVRHINTLFPSFIDNSPTSNYLGEAVLGGDGSTRGGLGSSGYGTRSINNHKNADINNNLTKTSSASTIALSSTDQKNSRRRNQSDAESAAAATEAAVMLSVDMEFKIRLERERKERALLEQEYPVDWRKAPTTQYESLKAAIASGSPIGRAFTPSGGGGLATTTSSTSSSPGSHTVNVTLDTKISGITWVYAAMNLSILPDQEQATSDATKLIDRLLHNPTTSEFQLPLVVSGRTRRADVRDMLRDARRFGVLVDIVATRRTVMTGIPHSVATAIYRHCDEHYPIYVKFVFVGVTDNGTKRVARDVFAGGNVPKNNVGVWSSAEGGVPHPLPFDAVDSEHQFIVHPSGEEAEMLRNKGLKERELAERESAARRCTAKYVPPPPPEWLVKLRAREEKKKHHQQHHAAQNVHQVGMSKTMSSFSVTNATLLYGAGDTGTSPNPKGYEQLYGRSNDNNLEGDGEIGSPNVEVTSTMHVVVGSTKTPPKQQRRPISSHSYNNKNHGSLADEVDTRRQINTDVAKYFGTSPSPTSTRPNTSASTMKNNHTQRPNSLQSGARAGGRVGSSSSPPSTNTLPQFSVVTPASQQDSKPPQRILSATSQNYQQRAPSRSPGGSHLIQGGSSVLLSDKSFNHLSVSTGGVGGGSPIAQQRRRRRRQLLESSMNPDAIPGGYDHHNYQPHLGLSDYNNNRNNARSGESFLSGGDGSTVGEGSFLDFTVNGGDEQNYQSPPQPSLLPRPTSVADISKSIQYVGDSSAKQQQSVEWAKIGTRVGDLERERSKKTH